jgi:hypothetical protein
MRNRAVRGHFATFDYTETGRKAAIPARTHAAADCQFMQKQRNGGIHPDFWFS